MPPPATTVPPCDLTVVGDLAALQGTFPAMPMPGGVTLLLESGLARVPGVAVARLTILAEPLEAMGEPIPDGAQRIWLEALHGRFGWLDLTFADRARFTPYQPYVNNLANAVALHAETLHQQERLRQMILERKHVEDAVHEIDRRKDEFLGVLSHELRNQLAPIRNSVYLLEHAALAGEQASRAKDVIRRQTEHLTRLVDDLLDVKRIATGKMRLHVHRIDLAQLVRDTVEDRRPQFVNRSIALELVVPGEPVWVNGDGTRLAQVVSNLLHNASKFADPGGHVRVSVETGEGQAHLRVRDDGVGVAPDLLPKLFEPFVQSEATLHRSRGGLGLGLSLVRGIAELHGAEVDVRSGGIGKGTEFLVTLPTTQPGVAAAPAVSVAASRRRVLIIDDNHDSAESLRDVLEVLAGHEVHVAHDGATGISAAGRQAPDVILCDLDLPDIDGHEVARRMRARGTEARLVAVSGYASPEDVERALRAGFDYHFPKPPDVDRLLALIADSPIPGAQAAAPSELLTGHHEVDAQHASILAEAKRLRRASPGAAWDSLRFLRHHTASHFAYEERLMDEVGYPRAALHERMHLDFAGVFRRLEERLQQDGATPENVTALADAVESWVAEHVLREDRRLAEFIRGR